MPTISSADTGPLDSGSSTSTRSECTDASTESGRTFSRNQERKRLLDIFEKNEDALIHKWEHYFPIYERHFERFVGKCPRVLEVGVFHGGSLKMWNDYFGPGTSLVGVDIDPRCKSLETAGTVIHIGDQGDRKFLREIVRQAGPFDIVIDDGGHEMQQQITTFQELMPAVRPFGVYLIEDLHTSYWDEFGGGYQRAGSFIEFAKTLIDEINGFHIRQGGGVTEITESVQSISFYDSIAVFEKSPKTPLISRATGKPSF